MPNGDAGQVAILNRADAGTDKNKWASLCRIAVTKVGTYHLQVKSSALTTAAGAAIADAANGWNQFSLKATVSGSSKVTPSLYGVGDLSLFNNLPGPQRQHHRHVRFRSPHVWSATLSGKPSISCSDGRDRSEDEAAGFA